MTIQKPVGPAAADLYRCVHCGFCLPNCPTYIETGLETASPRGRLALMKAVHEGRLQFTPRVEEHLDLCVQCRACEAVCPSGVPFGRIMEDAHAQAMAGKRMGLRQRLARWLALRLLLPRPGLLRAAGWLLKVYQRGGLQSAVRTYRLLAVFKGMDRMERQLPRLGKFFGKVPSRSLSAAVPEKGTTVALLTGCVMPLAYGRVHEATCRVLTANGCQVVLPKGQVCCGALHAHSGDLQMARELARRNVDAFSAGGAGVLVVNAAGCGAAMKEYGDLLKDDPLYAGKAAILSAKVQDVSQFLAGLPFRAPAVAMDGHVTYQDSCHLAQAQRIKDAPRKVLRSIPGLRLSEMSGSEVCCGAGGIYAFTHGEMSQRLLDHKLEHVADTGAHIIATSNPGCMMQLEAGLRRAGKRDRVVHVVELLDEAYRMEPRPWKEPRP